MEIESRRVDHLGIVAGMIRKVGMIKLIDDLLGVDDQNEVTPGEAVASMIMNGLGVSNRVLTLSPQFYETKALDILLRPGIKPEHLNRYKLGRVLEKVADYGVEKFFTTVALKSCVEEKVELRTFSSDVTSYALSGAYDEEVDLEEVYVKHGYSKDHRPDLKQIVQELAVSHDGGVPVMVSVWPGNTSDVEVLRERTKKLLKLFADSDQTPCMIGDSKLYNEENIRQLNKIKFVTRVPSTIKRETQIVDQAIAEDDWQSIDDKYGICEYNLNLYGVNQRWIVVKSQPAFQRAEKTLSKAVKKEFEGVQKKLFHLQAKRFGCESDAIKAVNEIEKKLKFHKISDFQVVKHARSKKRGRPLPEDTYLEYQVNAVAKENEKKMQHELEHRSCFVLATNLLPSEYSSKEILELYKKQDLVEKGFRFLKDPSFFASSLYLKNQKRLQGLLVIMTLAILIYSLAQRYIRQKLALLNLTIPNQIKQPTSRPTLRLIFQIIEGINYIKVKMNGVEQVYIDGLTEIRRYILKLFFIEVQQIYQLA